MKAFDNREFDFSVKDFERIRQLIYDHAGIALTDSKRELVYSRLSRRLRATGIGTFAEYLRLLESNNAAEWEAFTNSLTTNLTAFFREAHHFTLLAQQLQALGSARPIALWCSASSTGQEPYSMAMTAIDAFSSFSPPVTIIASDIDTQVLETAKKGVYALDQVEKLEPALVRRFFLKGTNQHSGMVRIRPEVQRLVTFRQVNLLDARWPIQGGLDAIFCRNVMIYFDKDTQLKILRNMAPLLNHKGLLYAGHSENFYHARGYFKLRGRTVYELDPAFLAQPKHPLRTT